MRAAGPHLVDRLAAFAAVHDRRGNVVCHAFAVPLLALAATVLLGLLRVHVGRHVVVTAADLGWIALAIAWLRLDARLGAATRVAGFLVLLLGNHLAAEGWVDGLLAVVDPSRSWAWASSSPAHAIEASRPAVLTDRRAAIIAAALPGGDRRLRASASASSSPRDIDRTVRRSLDHPAPFEPLAGL